MRITFVRPHLFESRSSDALEPLVFGLLAALTPGDVELELFDERVEPVPLDRDTDLIALTVETYTARRAYDLADAYRRRGVQVVMGGYHPTFLADEALQHADAVVQGDADAIWPQIVADARAHRLQPIYRSPDLPSLAGINCDRRLFVKKGYPVGAVQFGRGCRYACEFCSIHAFYGSSVRHRPAHEVAAEVEGLDRRAVLIVDDNLFVSREAAEELFRSLAPLGVKWGCQVSLDIVDDGTLLDLMARSGCIAALVGFESLDAGNLDQMRKRWNLKHGDYRTAIQRLHDRGIMVYGSFIFGYDHDTPDTIERTIEFAVESGLFLVNFSALTPTPGSRLYDRFREDGRLLYDTWWLDPRYRYGDAVFRPAQFTAGELTSACARARQMFYRYGSIVRRAWDGAVNRRSLSNLALFAGANFVSRRELASKLGRPLGSRGRSASVPPVVS